MKKFKVYAMAIGTLLASVTLWSCGGDDPDEPPYNNGSSSSTIMPAELNFGLDGGCKFVNINDSRYSV